MCVQGPERRVAFFTGTLTLTLLLCDACDFTCDLYMYSLGTIGCWVHTAHPSHTHTATVIFLR